MIRQFLIGPYSIKLTIVSYGFTRVPRHEKSIGNGATAEERLHHHITMALCDTIIVFETFILLLALQCTVVKKGEINYSKIWLCQASLGDF